MKIVEIKIIKVLSDGSTSFSYKALSDSNQFVFYEKDRKNFFMSKKKKLDRGTKINSYSKYKQKYL